MRLIEIEQDDAGEQRVQRLKDNAKAAKDKAKQLTTQANQGAEQLKVQQAGRQLAQSRKVATRSTIKPHA